MCTFLLLLLMCVTAGLSTHAAKCIYCKKVSRALNAPRDIHFEAYSSNSIVLSVCMHHRLYQSVLIVFAAVPREH
jgi:hypothetical protein